MTESAAGASARVEHQRRLARHKAGVRRRRSEIVLTAGAVAIFGFIYAQNQPVGWIVVVAAVLSAAVALFTTPQSVTAWAVGAEGEARTGRFLEPLTVEGFRVFHDMAIPGSRSNIDHIVIGPPGIVVVETKSLKGRLRVRGSDVYVNGRRTGMIEEVRREALAVQIVLADEVGARGYRIGMAICVHRADLPWRRLSVQGIPIVSGRGLLKVLRDAPERLSDTEVERVADLVAGRLRPAVHTSSAGGSGAAS